MTSSRRCPLSCATRIGFVGIFDYRPNPSGVWTTTQECLQMSEAGAAWRRRMT